MEFLNSKKIEGPVLIKPNYFNDERGSFLVPYIRKEYEAYGIRDDFSHQHNESFTVKKGTIRGLHFQKTKEHVQAKLVTVYVGSVFVAIVDLREGSPTYGKYEGYNLRADEPQLIFVPAGFAHGFMTLEENTGYRYLVSNDYAPDFEGGIKWNDPEVGIEWPDLEPIMNNRDANLPLLKDLKQVGNLFN